MPTSYKAYAKHVQMVDNLTKFLAATMPVVVNSADAEGNPVTTFSADSTPAAGEKVIVIRTKPIDRPTAKDSLGNPGITPSGHVIQICTEKNYEGATDNVLDILSPAQLLPTVVEIGRCGSFVSWYRTANGTVPSLSALNTLEASAPDGSWRDLYWNVLKAD